MNDFLLLEWFTALAIAHLASCTDPKRCLEGRESKFTTQSLPDRTCIVYSTSVSGECADSTALKYSSLPFDADYMDGKCGVFHSLKNGKFASYVVGCLCRSDSCNDWNFAYTAAKRALEDGYDADMLPKNITSTLVVERNPTIQRKMLMCLTMISPPQHWKNETTDNDAAVVPASSTRIFRMEYFLFGLIPLTAAICFAAGCWITVRNRLIEKELNADNVPPVALSKSDELDDELLSDAVERLQRITSRESRRSKETAYPTPSTRQAKASTVSSDTPATSKDSKRLMS